MDEFDDADLYDDDDDDAGGGGAHHAPPTPEAAAVAEVASAAAEATAVGGVVQAMNGAAAADDFLEAAAAAAGDTDVESDWSDVAYDPAPPALPAASPLVESASTLSTAPVEGGTLPAEVVEVSSPSPTSFASASFLANHDQAQARNISDLSDAELYDDDSDDGGADGARSAGGSSIVAGPAAGVVEATPPPHFNSAGQFLEVEADFDATAYFPASAAAAAATTPEPSQAAPTPCNAADDLQPQAALSKDIFLVEENFDEIAYGSDSDNATAPAATAAETSGGTATVATESGATAGAGMEPSAASFNDMDEGELYDTSSDEDAADTGNAAAAAAAPATASTPLPAPDAVPAHTPGQPVTIVPADLDDSQLYDASSEEEEEEEEEEKEEVKAASSAQSSASAAASAAAESKISQVEDFLMVEDDFDSTAYAAPPRAPSAPVQLQSRAADVPVSPPVAASPVAPAPAASMTAEEAEAYAELASVQIPPDSALYDDSDSSPDDEVLGDDPDPNRQKPERELSDWSRDAYGSSSEEEDAEASGAQMRAAPNPQASAEDTGSASLAPAGVKKVEATEAAPDTKMRAPVNETPLQQTQVVVSLEVEDHFSDVAYDSDSADVRDVGGSVVVDDDVSDRDLYSDDEDGSFALANESADGRPQLRQDSDPANPTIVDIDPALVKLFSHALIDSGSFADVYEGEYDRAVARAAPGGGGAEKILVAIKAFRGTRTGDSADAKIREELRVSIRASLAHRYLVKSYGVVRLPQHGLCLVMQRMAGRSLRRTLDLASSKVPAASLPWRLRTKWLSEVASAMGHLQSKDIVHRDLRAANVLLDHADISASSAFVSDFGLSTAFDSLQKQHHHTYSHGAPEWSAPETFAGPPSWEADCYSFGVLVYEVVSCKTPFYALSPPEKEAVRLEQLKFMKFKFDADLHGEYGITEEQQRTLWLRKREESFAQRRPDMSTDSIPADTPDALLDLIQRCWVDEPTNRPPFVEIVATLAPPPPPVDAEEVVLGLQKDAPPVLPAGSIADVFVAGTTGKFAIKVYRGSDTQTSAESVAMEQTAFRRLADVSVHPCLIQFYGCVFRPGLGVCLVMDNVRASGGKTLHQALEEETASRDRLHRWDEKQQWIREIATGMAHLHAHGIVHGDLRACNVMLVVRAEAGASACVGDFGLATIQSSVAVRRGYLATITDWTAPEMLVGGDSSGGSGANGRTSQTADIYSFGITLYEILSAKLPFYTLAHVEKEAMRLEQLKFAVFKFDADLQEEYGVTEEQQRALWIKKRAASCAHRRPDTSANSVPEDCPAQMRALMTQSWCDAVEDRKSFAEILNQVFDQ